MTKPLRALILGLTAVLVLTIALPVDAKGKPPKPPKEDPTPTPAPPLPPLDSGFIYARQDLPPINHPDGDVLSDMAPDGTNETEVDAPWLYPAAGEPSQALHNGRRWFVRWEPAEVSFTFPDGSAAYDVFAYEEVSGTRVQLTDSAGDGIAYNHPYGTVYWTADQTTGEPDGAIAYAAVKWVDTDNDGAFDQPDSSKSGVFIADVSFDGSGGITLTQPAAATVVIQSNSAGDSLYMFDFGISPDGTNVTYTKLNRELMVAEVPSSDPSIHQAIWFWGGDQPKWSAGTPGKIAHTGCSMTKRGKRYVRTDSDRCGIYVMNPDGTGAHLLVEPKGSTADDPSEVNVGWPEWSPNGTYLMYYERTVEQPGYIDVSRKLRRMAADGRDNVVLQDDRFGLNWVTGIDVIH